MKENILPPYGDLPLVPRKADAIAESIDIPLENKLPKEKLATDIKCGFRITITDDAGVIRSYVMVATKAGDDYFTVRADIGVVPKSDWFRPNSRTSFEIRRHNKVVTGRGSRTLEIWKVERFSDEKPKAGSFRIQNENGGILSEEEFLRRYESSTVDMDSTGQLFEVQKKETLKYYQSEGTKFIFEEGFRKDRKTISE